MCVIFLSCSVVLVGEAVPASAYSCTLMAKAAQIAGGLGLGDFKCLLLACSAHVCYLVRLFLCGEAVPASAYVCTLAHACQPIIFSTARGRLNVEGG